MVKEAFEKWIGSTNGAVPTAAVKEAFEAGWNAARAGPRSDAVEATGGRIPNSLIESLRAAAKNEQAVPAQTTDGRTAGTQE